jgi:tetratricopeptide (TPR) repeat protein
MPMKPLVVIVPSVFGSHLRDGSGRVWLDEDALGSGGLSRLAMTATQVAPDGVTAAIYRSLVEALEPVYEVNAFDYDWRQPLAVTAAQVQAVVTEALKEQDRRVHLVGHGWGGVVAVAAASDPVLAPVLAARQTQIVTLGAPFAGSSEVQRLLDGAHPLAKMLAKIANQPIGTVTSVLQAWSSLNECLPPRSQNVPGDVLPLLTTIAGTGVPTCVKVEHETSADGNRTTEYLFHADGDGLVAATNALVAGARHVTLECSHVQLVASPHALKVCLDQLASESAGPARTTARPASEPLQGGEDALPEVITSVELIEAATGALGSVTLVYPLSISVLHSHLRQAEYPLAIGHYRDDTIVSAEAALDVALGGRLSRRLHLDVYVGSAGATEILRLPGAHPPGAIVIGLGDVGDLTPERLTKLIAHAAVRYAVRVADASSTGTWVSAAFSTLLVGNDSGSMTTADSIRAIVRGVLEANRRLRATKMWDRVRIDRLQFVELFEDIAEQAAHIVNALPATLEQELTRSESVRPMPQLGVMPGGEYSRPPEDTRAKGWWRRVQVTGKTSSQSLPGGNQVEAVELIYTPLTDRAKLSQGAAVQSLAQVSRLVDASMLQSTADLKLSNTLFELLLPASFKNSIRHGGDLLLLLNRAAARYPFELMADREGGRPTPLIAKCGLLRQLELPEQPRKTDVTSGLDMLVIGPPLAPSWPPLPGAREEAHRIADLSRDRGFKPTLLVNASSRDVQTEVFASGARILHIAAHGQYSDNPLESGVVIGDNEYFTTANVAAMRRVPEFAFLNCCHLGQLGPATKSQTAFPALAASLAEGFMSAGVRAVIAAGWAVDDAAGLTFARAFYERFLSGELFGEAVRAARLATLERHPTTSTWGAFQCYGSPEYRLRSTAAAERRSEAKPPVSRGELIARLRSLAERAGGAHGPELTALVAEFQNQKKLVVEDERWRDGQTLAELANLAAQLEEFQAAIDLYRMALQVAKALAPLQAVEQLANMLGREAPRLAVTKGTGAAQSAIALFVEAVDWLDWLDQKLPLTAERLALRGAVHKRWAMLTGQAERLKHLRKALGAYDDARQQRPESESYHVLNWVSLSFLLKKQRRQQLLALTQTELDRARKKGDGPGERSFWDRVAIPDARLHAALLQGTLSQPAVIDEVDEAYGNALATGPSARERASVRDHLVFLAEMLPDPTLKLKKTSPLTNEFQRLIKRLS